MDSAPPMEVTPDGATYVIQVTAFISGSRYLSDVEDDVTAALESLTTVACDVQAVVMTPQ